MSTSIERVRRAVAQTPWAIHEPKLEQICEFLALRAEGQLTAEEIAAAAGQRRNGSPAKASGVAVLPIFGTIAHRMDWMTEMSGGSSCEAVGQTFDRFMADGEIGTIVLHVDSPGGTVPGVMELADKDLPGARGKGKRIIAIADAMAASAAYWIASAAEELIVVPSGLVGSIGVFTIHIEYSEALKQAGIKPTVIRAGKHKAEGNLYEELPEDARVYVQKQIDEIKSEFVGAVARHRGVTTAIVESDFGDGRVLKAKGALSVGMVDRIATLQEVLEELGVSHMRERSETRAEGPKTAPVEATADEANAVEATGPAAIGRFAGVEREAQVYLPADEQLGMTEEVQTKAGAHAGAASDPQHSAPIITPAPGAKENTVEDSVTTAAPGTPGAAENGKSTGTVVTGITDISGERQRAGTISELCEMHGIKGEAADYIASGASVDQVVASIRDRASANLEAMKASHVEMSEKDKRSYSINRAILAAADRNQNERPQVDDGFEREVSEHIRQRLPADYKSRGGFFAPMAVLNTGTATAGGNAVFTQEGDFIDLLRAQMKVAQLGATILTGLEGGTIAFPKQTSGGTWTWVAENPGSDVALSDAAVGQVLLAPKEGQSATSYTRKLLAQASISVEQFVRSDISLAAALGIDLAAINGSGASNQPTGILNTAGIGSVAGGTNGLAPTYAHMVDLETEIAIDNADIGSMAYLTTPGIRGKLKKTETFTTGNGAPVWTGGKEGEVNGYPGHVSTQVPDDLDKGTSTAVCHAVIFGVWSQLLIGYWGAMEVVVDPYTKKRQGLIEVANHQIVGLAVRHAEAFSAMQDALTS